MGFLRFVLGMVAFVIAIKLVAVILTIAGFLIKLIGFAIVVGLLVLAAWIIFRVLSPSRPQQV